MGATVGWMTERSSDEEREQRQRQRAAVERELQRRREPEERELVDAVGEEQRRGPPAPEGDREDGEG